MSDFDELTSSIRKFVDDRDWNQFHNPKDLAISLNLEAAELLEHFQWKSEKEIQSHISAHKKELGNELADVLYWVLLIANNLQINLEKSFKDKMKENNKKYPINKSKGNHLKYNQL